eukprot:CAMPEP_0204526602 /NCGR_PEP_ID=MMETSP0661-20131031/8529_1 /ASSEMBLY_ACC=CAM_ASM_000606 /TAXON_ID=109239 /ORGANISM="Alexandrium margalefi, Strain AMGDE01CS-322" /LENGTH=169 /DNA_ID=CAMNT_0051532457 /DNA_START=93 /DNA_END=602 /DNA_ORIENTATION=+
MALRSIASLLLVAVAAADSVHDAVSMVQRPMNPENPHPDQKADKEKRRQKELQKHLDEEERERRLHEHQQSEEQDRRDAVDENKRRAMTEKERRQSESKAAYKALEARDAKADNDMKEQDYAERNSRRAAHTLQRAADEERRRSRKAEEQRRLKDTQEHRAAQEAAIMR